MAAVRRSQGSEHSIGQYSPQLTGSERLLQAKKAVLPGARRSRAERGSGVHIGEVWQLLQGIEGHRGDTEASAS